MSFHSDEDEDVVRRQPLAKSLKRHHRNQEVSHDDDEDEDVVRPQPKEPTRPFTVLHALGVTRYSLSDSIYIQDTMRDELGIERFTNNNDPFAFDVVSDFHNDFIRLHNRRLYQLIPYTTTRNKLRWNAYLFNLQHRVPQSPAILDLHERREFELVIPCLDGEIAVLTFRDTTPIESDYFDTEMRAEMAMARSNLAWRRSVKHI